MSQCEAHNPSPALSQQQLHSLQSLWTDANQYSASKNTDALEFFLHQMCQLVDAKEASWVAMKKTPSPPKRNVAQREVHRLLNGWIPCGGIYTDPTKDFTSIVSRWYRSVRKQGLDFMTVSTRAAEGQSRIILRQDFCTDDEWETNWFSNNYLPRYGVGERAICVYAIDNECEVCILLDREVGAKRFTETDRKFIFLACMGIANLHRLAILERGITQASSQLSQREQQTFSLLLTDNSESEIADIMGLSAHTIHDYSRNLYQKFKVRGRAGLMALALGA